MKNRFPTSYGLTPVQIDAHRYFYDIFARTPSTLEKFVEHFKRNIKKYAIAGIITGILSFAGYQTRKEIQNTSKPQINNYFIIFPEQSAQNPQYNEIPSPKATLFLKLRSNVKDECIEKVLSGEVFKDKDWIERHR